MKKRNYSKIPESDVVIDYVIARFKKGLYTLTLVSGLPGTGKTSTCLRLAELTSIELIGKNKITSENIVDSLLELVAFIQKANQDKVNIAIVEEVSVLFPSRRAMSGDNVAIGKILDTCRKKKVILYANAPLWTGVDSHMRCLGNIYVETLRINKTEKIVTSKALRLQTNPGSGKTYWHRFRRKGREVHRIFTRMPNQETWDDYEARKDKFMEDLYEELQFRARRKKDKILKEMGKLKLKAIRPLAPMELKVYEGIVRQGKSQKDVARELGVSCPNISLTFKKVKEKLGIPLKNEQNKLIEDKKGAVK